MAIFHLNAKVISRGKGQSAIAAAAYRSGDRLRDEQAGQQKYYTSRAERIQFTDIMAPKDAPEWAHDRNRLWNEAERAEKRKDAQLAREIEISLPHELTAQQREWLVKDFAREAFVRKGYAVDIAIHAPDPGKDERNHHAHLMVTMRTLGQEGFAATKDRALNSKEQLGVWREQWAHLANRHLERHGHEARIDHRSLKQQGADREPTMHLGYAANQIAARGAQSDRMEQLKDILARNEIRLDIKALNEELRGLEQQQAREAAAQAERGTNAKPQTQQRPTSTPAQPSTQAPTPAPVPSETIHAQHKAAEAERARLDTMQQHPRAEQADRQAAHAPKPGKGRASDSGGFKVVDGATGIACGLGDFMLGLIGGSSAPPAPTRADMKAFVSDPAARKAQQLASLAATRAEKADQRARERMYDDIQAGRGLSASDIRNLTHAHQIDLLGRGDDAVREMVQDAQRRRGRWQGDERERDR